MKCELTVYELGQLLQKVASEYKTSILAKINLSGGWMTMQGEVGVQSVPTDKIVLKGNNIIVLKVKMDNDEGSEIKITGAKDKKFSVVVAPKKVIEIHTGGLGLQREKERTDECTIKIDDSIIFNIKAGMDIVETLV